MVDLYTLACQSADKEDPPPVQHLLNPIADSEGQTVPDVDAKVVDADGSASYLHGEVVSNERHGKGVASSSTVCVYVCACVCVCAG